MQTEIPEMLALCRQRGLTCQDLDEVVYDTMGEAAAKQLNEQPESASAEGVLQPSETRAGQINNQGLKAQIEFLLSQNGADSTREILLTLERESNVL